MKALHDALQILGAGFNLSFNQTRDAVAQIFEGEAPDLLVGSFLTALRVKGETASELAGAVAAARDRMILLEPFDPPARTLDTCGTGGDGACSVNISTATAIVVAACGIPVAKHGNRSASGNSGSSEVLTELGVVIDAEPAVLRRCLSEVGITFLFAPKFHPALRLAAPVRRQLPFRTLFNLIGPLVNPTRPVYQLIGVPGAEQARLMSEVIAETEIDRAAIVTGSDGLDEVTLGGPTSVLWVEGKTVRSETWSPESFGLGEIHAESLRVSGPVESATQIRRMLAAEVGPVRDTVLANASAALLVANRVTNLRQGVELAKRGIDSGDAAKLLSRWSAISRS